MDEVQQLGGNIELAGFHVLDGGSVVVLKKVVGSYARKFSDRVSGFEKLVLTMKLAHQSTEQSHPVFEVHGRVIAAGKVFASEQSDRNVFFAVDNVLKRISSEALKE